MKYSQLLNETALVTKRRMLFNLKDYKLLPSHSSTVLGLIPSSGECMFGVSHVSPHEFPLDTPVSSLPPPKNTPVDRLAV